MKVVRRNRWVSAILLLCLIAVTVATDPTAQVASAAASSHSATAVAGAGFWENLACVGCIAGFIVASGTTVAGLAIVLQLNPELAILCFNACSSLVT